MNTYESRTKIKTIATVVTIVVIIGIVIVIELVQQSEKTQSKSTVSSSTTSTSGSAGTAQSASDTSNAQSANYKDGTYTADASYYVPHGYEDIQVTLTVANGIVTDSSIVNSESDRDSARYQEEFASEYKSMIVGKSLSDLKLSYVAGASDTTSGFNDAVAKIQTKAQS